MRMRYGFSSRDGKNSNISLYKQQNKGHLVVNLIYRYGDQLLKLPVSSHSDPNAETVYMIREINEKLGFRVWETSPFFDRSMELYLPLGARVHILNVKTACSRPGYYRKWLIEDRIDPDTLVDPTEPVIPTF